SAGWSWIRSARASTSDRVGSLMSGPVAGLRAQGGEAVREFVALRVAHECVPGLRHLALQGDQALRIAGRGVRARADRLVDDRGAAGQQQVAAREQVRLDARAD